MNIANPRRAFTLVELLAVLAIIAVLATLLIPNVGSVLTEAKRTQALSNLSQIAKSYYQLSIASAQPQRITGADTDAWALALAEAGGVENAALYFAGIDAGNFTGASVRSAGFGGSGLSYTVVANLPSTLKDPSTTPILWTRGHTAGGTWASDSPWEGEGGHVAFADGHVEWFTNTAGKLLLYSDKTTATGNLENATTPAATVVNPRAGQ